MSQVSFRGADALVRTQLGSKAMQRQGRMSVSEIVRYLLVSALALDGYAIFVKEAFPEFLHVIVPPLVMTGLAYYVARRTGSVLFAVGMSWASFFLTGLLLLAAVGVARVIGAGFMDHLIASPGGDEMTLGDDIQVILTGVATVPLQFLAALIATRRRSNDLSHAAEPSSR